MAHSIQAVFACEDPEKLATFWAGALGYILQPPPPGFDTWEAFATAMKIPEDKWGEISAAIDPDGDGPRLLFERFDGGTPNQRVHLDINSVGPGEFSDDERRFRLAEERAPVSNRSGQPTSERPAEPPARSGSKCSTPMATGSACNDPRMNPD